MARPRITREERLTFYRMLIHQVYPEPDYRILVNDGPCSVGNGTACSVFLTEGPIIRYLHEHPDMMQQFMRYTRSVRRTEGQTNNFYLRIYRMIQTYLEG